MGALLSLDSCFPQDDGEMPPGANGAARGNIPGANSQSAANDVANVAPKQTTLPQPNSRGRQEDQDDDTDHKDKEDESYAPPTEVVLKSTGKGKALSLSSAKPVVSHVKSKDEILSAKPQSPPPSQSTTSASSTTTNNNNVDNSWEVQNDDWSNNYEDDDQEEEQTEEEEEEEEETVDTQQSSLLNASFDEPLDDDIAAAIEKAQAQLASEVKKAKKVTNRASSSAKPNPLLPKPEDSMDFFSDMEPQVKDNHKLDLTEPKSRLGLEDDDDQDVDAQWGDDDVDL